MSDVEAAVAAADAGAAVLRAKFGKSLMRFDKSLTDFATDADFDAEKAIMDVLRAERPTDAYIGEEQGALGNEASNRTWLIDPLCGTPNFAAETPLVAVNVALRHLNHIKVAAIAAPFTNEVFWTEGFDVHASQEGVDKTVGPSAVSCLVDVNLDAPYFAGDQFQAVRMLADPAFMEVFRPRVLSSTLPLAWVAVGRRAAYVTAGQLRDSVHFSSGIALCQAAGCVVTGLRGQPLHTGVGGLVAAADAQTHAALIEIINHQFASWRARSFGRMKHGDF
jgi:myo-inositol-1(or 4)-monophosphatase